MKRHLTAALLTGALALSPAAAAFAQDEEPAPVETTALEDLATYLAEAAEVLAEGDAEEGLTDLIAAVLAGFSETLFIESMEADALAVVANQEDEEEGDDADDAEGANGEAVSTLAHCAPRGTFKDIAEGMKSHGAYVTAAAHGETVGVTVPTLVTDEETGETTVDTETTEVTDFDLSTVEGAEGLCAALDVVYQARLLDIDLQLADIDDTHEARKLASEACKIERLRAKNAEDGDAEAAKDRCAELRQVVRDLREEQKAEKAEAREQAKADRDADRDAAREARAEAREQAKAERAESKAAKGAKGDDTD